MGWNARTERLARMIQTSSMISDTISWKEAPRVGQVLSIRPGSLDSTERWIMWGASPRRGDGDTTALFLTSNETGFWGRPPLRDQPKHINLPNVAVGKRLARLESGPRSCRRHRCCD